MGTHLSCSFGWCDLDKETREFRTQVFGVIRDNMYKIPEDNAVMFDITLKHTYKYSQRNRAIFCHTCRRNMLLSDMQVNLKHPDLHYVMIRRNQTEDGFFATVQFNKSHKSRVWWSKLRVFFHMLVYWFRFRARYYAPGNGGYLRAYDDFNTKMLKHTVYNLVIDT